MELFEGSDDEGSLPQKKAMPKENIVMELGTKPKPKPRQKKSESGRSSPCR